MLDRFERFSSALFDISRHWHKIAGDVMEKHNLKGTYAIYLTNIANSPEGITAAKLSEMCSRDKADVSRALSELEKRGLIVKSNFKGSSYRAAITLTEEGAAIANHVKEQAAIAVCRSGGHLSDSQRTVFYNALESICANLRILSEQGLEENGINTVLFDLDGTLLPMDQEEFMKAYFDGMCRRLAPLGYDPDTLVKTIWSGTKAMVKNDGSRTNEDAFWNEFKKTYPDISDSDIAEFDSYYKEDFDNVAEVCPANPKAVQAVEYIKSKFLRVALATNPLFPSAATEKRITWAGMKPSDFEYITTYENSHYTKPNPDYYKEVMKQLGVKPEQCLMVGNDISEDMIARELGMKVFLLTDCLINTENKDISQYPNGGFAELLEYIDSQL